MPRSRRLLLVAIFLAIFLVALAVLLFTLPGPTRTPAKPPLAASALTVTFLDVGQGDSILIRTATGKAALIDTGPSQKAAKDTIQPALKEYGVRALDYLVLTHSDQDHSGGANVILDSVSVTCTVFAATTSDNKAYNQAIARQDNCVGSRIRQRGDKLDLGGEIEATVLNPPAKRFGDDNNDSIVLSLKLKQVTILLMADAELRASRDMAAAGLDLRANLLKVSHHGSSTGTDGTLLEAVRPSYAVISVGANNRYGHPDGETLDVLESHSITTYRTDRNGTVTAHTDGLALEVETTRH